MAFLANNLSCHGNKILNLLPLPFVSNHFSHSPCLPFSKLPHIVSNRKLTLSAVAKTAAADIQLQDDKELITTTPAPSSSNKAWLEFAEKVSGEWDGYGADFTPQGSPIELPERVVPETFREWEVKVFDWQTQCPTLAQPLESDPSVAYKLIKLLPTVGCEADAATRYTVQEKNVGGIDNHVSAFAYQSSGCYVAVWPAEDKRGQSELMELEYCLVDPKNWELRVRIIQVVSVDNSKLVLKNIRVFCEQWYGPFRNGEQLGGCAIRDSTFAATDALKGSLVSGVWQGPNAVASFQNSNNNFLQEFSGDTARQCVRNELDLILLPRQLWSSLKDTSDGGTCCEVGWILDNGRAITSRCIFTSDLKLKEIAIASETAVPEKS